jgi:hypothetical protein
MDGSASSSSALAERELSSVDRDLLASPPVETTMATTADWPDRGVCQAFLGRSR